MSASTKLAVALRDLDTETEEGAVPRCACYEAVPRCACYEAVPRCACYSAVEPGV